MNDIKALRLNGNQLKLIAVVSMVLDHIGYLLGGDGCLLPRMDAGEPPGVWGPVYCFLRMVGRVAFPIFCFFLLEGFLHTRDWKRYALRLGVFAVIAEIPFDLMGAQTAVDWEAQNVFFTLFLGLLLMKALEMIQARIVPDTSAGPRGLGMEPALFLQLLVILLFCGAAWLLRTDYDYIGIMLIALFYWFRQDRRKQCVLGFVWMSVTMGIWYIIPGLALGFLLIYLYNGQRGSWRGKYFFYLFYPVHMVMLAAVYDVIFR